MKQMLRAVKHRIKKKFPRTWEYLRNEKYDIIIFLNDLQVNIDFFFANIKKRGCFLLQGKKIKYFSHRINLAYLNERSVEVPIVHNFIRKHSDKNILEIGNVLSNYFDANWDIVDKYEKAKDVINEDIIDFKPPKQYDLIVSISTFEHIGFDEKDKDDSKVVDAINHVKNNLLAADGLFIITVPLGYNTGLDKKLFSEELGFNRIYYLRRISADNRWEECKKENIAETKFNSPYKYANALAICATKDLDFNHEGVKN